MRTYTFSIFESLILRDKSARRYESDLENYLAATYKTLSRRIEKIKNSSIVPTEKEKQELFSILETFFNVKEMALLRKRNLR